MPALPTTAYCLKCKQQRAINGAKEKTSSKMRMLQGTCSKCGTKVARILPRK